MEEYINTNFCYNQPFVGFQFSLNGSLEVLGMIKHAAKMRRLQKLRNFQPSPFCLPICAFALNETSCFQEI